MTSKTRTIDQLVKLSTRVAGAWLNKPGSAGDAMTGKAILAVCKHLSREASYRTDISELIGLCESAAKLKKVEKVQTIDLIRSADEETRNILTMRQQEILVLFARGLSYEEVGVQLNVTAKTIKNHASSIYDRLGVKNKTEAVFEARSLGLLI